MWPELDVHRERVVIGVAAFVSIAAKTGTAPTSDRKSWMVAGAT
jgi:hypothetical protein